MSFAFASRAALAAAAMAVVTGAPASAATILPGTYRLHNHPDGNQRPPLYGARFDELFNATSGHDVFTLDFDDLQSAVFLTVNAARTEIRIFGVAVGGRDTGSARAADQYLGLYTLDFTYNVGVGLAPGDDDLRAATANHSNFGSITVPASAGGQTIALTDEAMGGYSFRLGDEDNDLGHRGFSGLSGWGWMSTVSPNGVPNAHIASTDWIFTATYEIPTPATAALMGLGTLVGLRRRRR